MHVFGCVCVHECVCMCLGVCVCVVGTCVNVCLCIQMFMSVQWVYQYFVSIPIMPSHCVLSVLGGQSVRE